MRAFVVCALALAAAVAPTDRLRAQVFTPSYQAPTRAADLGVHLADGFPGSDGIALEGVWRRGFGAYDLGLRAGIADQLDGAALLVGGDYRNPLQLDTAPVALAVTGGAQAVLGDESAIGLDVGLSVGATFTTPQLAVTPYLHPRIGLLDGLDPDDDLDLAILADAGVDLAFAPRFVLRLGIGFGDTADFGIGLAWR